MSRLLLAQIALGLLLLGLAGCAVDLWWSVRQERKKNLLAAVTRALGTMMAKGEKK